MKRKIFAVMTAIMVLAMSTTVMAAGSQDAKTATTTTTTASSNETAAKAVTGASTASGTTLTVKACDTATYNTMVSACKAAGATTVLAVAEYSGTLKSGGETIGINVATIKAGDSVAVIHQGKKGMEVLKPSEVGNGYVKVYMTDLSPIAVIKVPANFAGYTRSPKTGETIALMLIAIAALTGAVICGRKAKNN